MYSVINFKYVAAYPTNPASRNDVGIGILDRDAGALGAIPPLVPVSDPEEKILRRPLREEVRTDGQNQKAEGQDERQSQKFGPQTGPH